METKDRKTVINELADLFEVSKYAEQGSSVNDDKFFISKMQMSRWDVMMVLQEYFSDKTVKDGYVKVEPITFIHTVFTVSDGKPKMKQSESN